MIEETFLIWSQKDKKDMGVPENRVSWREQRTREMIGVMRTSFLQHAIGQVATQVTKPAELAESTTVLYCPVHKYSHS